MTANHWIQNAVFYHIYPLGFTGAPLSNDFISQPLPRLDKIAAWVDHMQSLGVTALYLGPVFESSSHGYDTADYYSVDRRLGTNATLKYLSDVLHTHGIRLILDAVFNHVGRDFWAFRDVQAHREDSPYPSWFANLRFDQTSPYNDPFSYESWNGHYNLVKLNLSNPQVRDHLFNAIQFWMCEFNIDGLRLDAADCLDFDFLSELSTYCRKIRPDFWLLGEVIHGDYRNWANPTMLDSVTNYECFKGLYSSHADANYFEIAYALNRQFGPEGIYRHLPLYSFADNHDVDRVASSLIDPSHLFTLYLLLFTMPGVPSIYYGSEWGIQAIKDRNSDLPLRPNLDLAHMIQTAPQPDLPRAIAALSSIRSKSPALTAGEYRQICVSHQQFVFLREAPSEKFVIAINSSKEPTSIDLTFPQNFGNRLRDLLNPGDVFTIQENRCILPLPANWGRILRVSA